jgi:hypothetical protein
VLGRRNAVSSGDDRRVVEFRDLLSRDLSSFEDGFAAIANGPVVYGQLAPGAGQMAAAKPLQAGVEYRAALLQRSEGGRVLAETRFTP